MRIFAASVTVGGRSFRSYPEPCACVEEAYTLAALKAMQDLEFLETGIDVQETGIDVQETGIDVQETGREVQVRRPAPCTIPHEDEWLVHVVVVFAADEVRKKRKCLTCWLPTDCATFDPTTPRWLSGSPIRKRSRIGAT